MFLTQFVRQVLIPGKGKTLLTLLCMCVCVGVGVCGDP